jgi:hypothetical protein
LIAIALLGCKLSTIGRTRFLPTIVASNINIRVKAFPPTERPVTVGRIAL